jgi:hypothetical protein
MARSATDAKTNTLLLEDLFLTGGGGATTFSFRVLFGFFSPSTAAGVFLIFFTLSSSLQALASMPLESSWCFHDDDVVVVVVYLYR